MLNTTQKDIDQFFEQERVYLSDYYNNIRSVTHRSDTMTKSHKGKIIKLGLLFFF